MGKNDIRLYNLSYMLGLFILIMAMARCSDDDEIPTTPDAETILEVRLRAGGSEIYENLQADITGVSVRLTNSTITNWYDLPLSKPGKHDLSQAVNGKDILLSSSDFYSGTITRVRLTFGNDNSVEVDGNSYKLYLHEDRTEYEASADKYITYNKINRLYIELDTQESVVSTGTGYEFSPKLRTYDENQTSIITGSVHPPEARPVVTASNGTENYTSVPGSDGIYFFGGLDSGDQWEVNFEPRNNEYDKAVVKKISLEKGRTTVLPEVILEKTAD